MELTTALSMIGTIATGEFTNKSQSMLYSDYSQCINILILLEAMAGKAIIVKPHGLLFVRSRPVW